MEKLINCISRASLWKKTSVAEVTFTRTPQSHKNINVLEKLLVSPRQIVIIKCRLSSYERKNSSSRQSSSFWEICSPSRCPEYYQGWTVSNCTRNLVSFSKRFVSLENVAIFLSHRQICIASYLALRNLVISSFNP